LEKFTQLFIHIKVKKRWKNYDKKKKKKKKKCIKLSEEDGKLIFKDVYVTIGWYLNEMVSRERWG
jgi:hypothetical protein